MDPPDPVPSAFALADFEQRENERFQRHNEFLLNAELQSSGGIFDRGFAADQVGLLAETNALQAIGQLGGANQAANASVLSGLSQGLSSASTLFQNRAQNRQNQANLDGFLNAIGANRQANRI